jgi:hypothetical protein
VARSKAGHGFCFGHEYKVQVESPHPQTLARQIGANKSVVSRFVNLETDLSLPHIEALMRFLRLEVRKKGK